VRTEEDLLNIRKVTPTTRQIMTTSYLKTIVEEACETTSI